MLAMGGACHAQELAPAWLPGVAVEAHLDSVLFDLPVSADVENLDPGQTGQAGVHVSEVVASVPGVLVHSRQNYAQDDQLSIRGFGARSTFGIRGVRLYTDGIPATMPDGQGQITHFDLDGGGTVSVMRGPYSALFGNSSGGVVAIDTADPPRDEDRLTLALGSEGLRRTAYAGSGRIGGGAYALDLSHLDADGYRDHSRAGRDAANAKFVFHPAGQSRVVLLANSFYSPNAQDPLGLSWQQYQADPRQAAAAATQLDTRKSVRQNQVGAVFEQDWDDGNALRAMGYAGQRSVFQVLGIPVAAQASPLSAGGIVDLATDYGGGDLRFTHDGALLGRAVRITMGIASDQEWQRRRGYENFVGDRLGLVGNLRRDQRDRITGVDEYLQLRWDLSPRWSLVTGARHSEVRLQSHDGYITARNPDDSGQARYASVSPVAAIEFRAYPALRFFASAGRGFETPTSNELAYRGGGDSGLANSLQAARSTNREAGFKFHSSTGLQVEAAVFRSDTRDELAVLSNVGGRAVYQNVPRTLRRGQEFALVQGLGEHWQWRAAWTRLHAEFGVAFLACSVTPCVQPTTRVGAGTSLPGVPAGYGSLRLEYAAAPWRAGIEAQAAGHMSADDAGTAIAPGYAVAAFDVGREWRAGAAVFELRGRIDNLFDRRYVGSVIVNDGNGRYFEPAPGRSFLALARWRW